MKFKVGRFVSMKAVDTYWVGTVTKVDNGNVFVEWPEIGITKEKPRDLKDVGQAK